VQWKHEPQERRREPADPSWAEPPFFAISATRNVAVLQPGEYTTSADRMLR